MNKGLVICLGQKVLHPAMEKVEIESRVIGVKGSIIVNHIQLMGLIPDPDGAMPKQGIDISVSFFAGQQANRNVVEAGDRT